ncbi:hypothetical protein KY334_02310 [Candidatus Woesearchaeota archaeon]|nr:hypothetical protein [Candidatus Woesearchaeota archaeon]
MTNWKKLRSTTKMIEDLNRKMKRAVNFEDPFVMEESMNLLSAIVNETRI